MLLFEAVMAELSVLHPAAENSAPFPSAVVIISYDRTATSIGTMDRLGNILTR